MVLFPRALRRGDKVAVVSPAGPVRDRPALDRGLERLRSWGLKPQLLPSCLERSGYLAGTDAQRTADLQIAIADPEHRAVFCSRGGYGTTRILDRIDFRPLAKDPKPLLGYSDATALLAAAHRAVGLVGFHGPMVCTTRTHEIGADCVELQRALLFDAGRIPALPIATEEPQPHVISAGTAEGRLVGGNLSLVVALIGTPWQIDTAGALVFLEDVDEAPYRVDRMLTQLRLTGFFAKATGVILGDFHEQDANLVERDPSDFVRVFHDRLEDLTIPVTHGWPFGHRARAWTLPYGARARLTAGDRSARPRLDLLEPAVRG